MAQANPFDQFDSQAQPVPMQSLQPIIGANPIAAEAEARQAESAEATIAGNTFRTMTAAEVAAQGLPADGVYQINGLGEVKTIRAPKAGGSAMDAAQSSANLLLQSAGVTGGKDPVADLIKSSTSGALQRFGAETLGAVTGESTTGMENIGKLRTIVADMTLAFTEGKLGAGVSNADVQFLKERVGNLADPNIPANERLAAWEEVKGRLQRFAGQEAPAPAAAPPTRAAAEGEAFLTDQDKELQTKLSEAFAAGATRDELNAIAAPYGQNINNVTQEELDRVRAAGGGISVVPTGRDDPEYQAKIAQAADSFEQRLGETGMIELAKEGMTFGLTGEASGVGQAIGEALTGDFNVADNYAFGRDVQDELLRRARERTGVAGTAAEVIGGGGGVRLAGNAAMQAGRSLAAAGQPVTRSAIQGRMVRNAAGEGALVGGVAGFGYGEGAEESLANAALGAGTGAALGVIMQRIANRRSNRGQGGGGTGGAGGGAPTSGGQVIQAADEFNRATGANLEPLPADTGGAITRRATSAVAQTTFGAKPIVEAAERANEQGRAGIRALAERLGVVPGSKQAAGEVAARGANKVIKNTKTKVDVLYAKARRAAQGAELRLPMAGTVLQSHIDELSKVPGGAEGLDTLMALKKSIDGGVFPVEGIKQMRQTLRDKFIKDGLRGSDLERRVNEVIEAADLDIEDGLVALGKADAARAYAEASGAAAERFKLIDDIFEPVLGAGGKNSGEQVFGAIERLSRGDAVTLGKFMKALPADEANSVKAAIIDRLGRVSRGRQDATGEAFSLNDFLTRWNDEGMSREAKAALFDSDTRSALDALARVAQGTKEGQRFANFSNTGGVNAFNFILNGAPFGVIATGVLPALAAGGVSVTAQFALGKLLSKPKFARWLAKLPEQKNPQATTAHINRLSNIAAADAAIAADVSGLQQALMSAYRQGATPVAAESQNEGSNTIRVEIK